MKYCPHCGHELVDDAVICTGCGRSVAAPATTKGESGLTTAAKVFMILGTIVTSLCGFLIPLAWCLPMTISYCNKLKRGEPVSTGFKVCSLLFVSVIGGILMLCDTDN